MPIPICKRCDDKGFIETWFMGSAGTQCSLQQCPVKCNIKAYSDEVRKRLSPQMDIEEVIQERKGTVIAFRKPSVHEFNGA